jgi:hypothetical protein
LQQFNGHIKKIREKHMAAIPRKLTKIVKNSEKKYNHSEFMEIVNLQNQTFTSTVLPKGDKHFYYT